MLRKPWLLTIGLCLSIFFILALIKFFQIRAAIAFGESFPEPSETVHQQAVAYANWRPSILVAGEVKAPREAELRNEVAGVIATVGFRPGAFVKQGDVLLQLDIAEEQARLAALQPQIKLAQKDVERLSGIKNRQAVSQQLIDQARSQLGVVQGEAAAIRESIANKTVRAPFDGQAGLHDFEVGEYLVAGSLITRLIGANDELWVDFALPQQHAKLSLGDSVKVSAMDDTGNERIGRVTVIEPALSTQSRTLNARATIGNLDKAIFPGAFVSVTAPTGESRTAIILPSSAVRVDTLGHYVFLLEKDANQQFRAKRQLASLLATRGQQSIIEPTINEGALVATLGAYKLREGILVNIGNPNTMPAAAAVETPASTVNNSQSSTETQSSETQSAELMTEPTDALMLPNLDSPDAQPANAEKEPEAADYE